MMPPPFVGLRNINRAKIKPMSREEQLKLIKSFKDAQVELERICAEKGIPVPVMVCKAVA
ncbi:hypothetical protein D3C85_238960 [compost metagenome]|jgi:hypothetical protein